MIRYQKKRKRKNTLREKNTQKGQKLQKNYIKLYIIITHKDSAGER